MSTAGLTLDTGALLAIERGDPKVRALLGRAIQTGLALHVPCGVIAQAWRGGPRQARLASLLNAREIQVIPLDGVTSRAVGRLCGLSGQSDIVDVSVILNAREYGHQVITSDPHDLRGIDPQIPLIVI